jgi:transcriptional regulator with GAF, ATPase, and Fis domain
VGVTLDPDAADAVDEGAAGADPARLDAPSGSFNALGTGEFEGAAATQTPKKKFPDYVPPTKITYADGRPKTIHLRKCRLSLTLRGKTKEFEFDQSVVRIGALEDNDLVIEDDTVSRNHCKIVQEDNAYVLVDLNSTNGTFINRVRIREAFLKPDCTIGLGNTEVKFHPADEQVEIIPSRKEQCGDIIGRNAKMRELFAIVEKIAPTGTTIIIEGETGTGKEVAAQTIHKLSNRSSGPMMVFDCGAVPETLIESELFGHEKGSFTGAIMTRQGLFEMAHGGTLFLDELGELPLELQPKLLRALEQREIRRVGAAKPLKVDVRIIAATNRNLEAEVAAGRFRQDLFYRLSVVRLFLPPLRERPEDIPLLVSHILKSHSSNRKADGGRKISGLSREAVELLTNYRWPGNVRELVNTVERAISFADGSEIQAQDLPDHVRHGRGGAAAGSPHTPPPSPAQNVAARVAAAGPPPTEATFKDAKEQWVTTFERDYIATLLRKNGGNISHAAREADIDRKYFRKLMRKHGLTAAGNAGDEDDDEDDDGEA